MGYVRQLRPEEVGEARAIARLKDRHSGTDPISDDGLDVLMMSVGDESQPRRIYGFFDDGRLVSWLAVRHVSFHGELGWLITALFTSDFHNHFSFTRPEVGKLIAYAFEEAEAEHRYTYVYSVANRLARVYEKQWAKQTWTPMTGRYELHTLGVVPANTEAPTEWQYRMMGGIKSDDVVFKKRVLKPEHRNITS